MESCGTPAIIVFPITKSDAYSSALVLFGNITLQKSEDYGSRS